MSERDARTGIVDVCAATTWITAHVPAASAPLSFRQIPGGRSNLTYAVDDAAGHRFVLRRPPAGDLVASAHNMSREFDVLDALQLTPVPVPATVAHCTDFEVLGADFYLMEHVDGLVLDAHAVPSIPYRARHHLSEQIVDTLAALHRVDHEAVGLSRYVRPGSYLSRQLRRWSLQLEQLDAAGTDVAALLAVHRRLAELQPPQRYTGIVHGDYRPGNLLVGPDGAVRAVLDWELWTVGDVLADLGWLVATWTSDEAVGWAPRTGDGFGSASEIAHRYCAQTGHEIDALDYYHAFSLWKLACIAQGVLRRYRSGAMGEHEVDLDALAARPALLCDRATHLLAHRTH